MQACTRHQSRKNAFHKSSLPTATLSKATLLLSLLLPAVKLLLKIQSCTAKPPILQSRWCSAQYLRRWLQQMPCCLRSLFCYHLFFFFSFFTFLSPRLNVQ